MEVYGGSKRKQMGKIVRDIETQENTQQNSLLLESAVSQKKMLETLRSENHQNSLMTFGSMKGIEPRIQLSGMFSPRNQANTPTATQRLSQFAQSGQFSKIKKPNMGVVHVDEDHVALHNPLQPVKSSIKHRFLHAQLSPTFRLCTPAVSSRNVKSPLRTVGMLSNQKNLPLRLRQEFENKVKHFMEGTHTNSNEEK